MSTTVTKTQTKEATRTIKSSSQSEDRESINSEVESWEEAVQAGQSDSVASMATAAEDNSQENQAEEKSKCGRCRGNLSDRDAIIPCEICKQNFHIQCENVNKTLHKTIMDSKKPRSKVKIHWYCAACDVVTVNMMQHVSVLEDNQKKLQRRVSDLEIEVKRRPSEEEFKKLEGRVTKLEKAKVEQAGSARDTETTKATTSEMIKEIKDQEERKRNIVLHNVTEKNTENAEERTKHDREQLKELGKVCKQTIKKEDVVMIRRLGKRNGNRPRPLLVEFKDEEKKAALMQNLVNLSNAPDNLRKISVQHDLTKKQREEEKKMREEAKKMESEDESGEYNYRIRGPPWDRRIVRMKKREN